MITDKDQISGNNIRYHLQFFGQDEVQDCKIMQYYQNIGDYNQAKQLFDQYYKIRTSISENIYYSC